MSGDTRQLSFPFYSLDFPERWTLKVGEVAERSGFVDPNYFSRAFRRSTGMTPLEFRRRSESSGGVTIRS